MGESQIRQNTFGKTTDYERRKQASNSSNSMINLTDILGMCLDNHADLPFLESLWWEMLVNIA